MVQAQQFLSDVHLGREFFLQRLHQMVQARASYRYPPVDRVSL
jgi:hypothetical protein